MRRPDEVHVDDAHPPRRRIQDHELAGLALYTLLAQMTGNPMVVLNQAVAAAMVHGPRAGLDLLAQVATDARLAGHYRVDAVRGHLLERFGDREAAIASYRAAAAKTTSLPERDYLMVKAARLVGARPPVLFE